MNPPDCRLIIILWMYGIALVSRRDYMMDIYLQHRYNSRLHPSWLGILLHPPSWLDFPLSTYLLYWHMNWGAAEIHRALKGRSQAPRLPRANQQAREAAALGGIWGPFSVSSHCPRLLGPVGSRKCRTAGGSIGLAGRAAAEAGPCCMMVSPAAHRAIRGSPSHQP